MGASTDGIVRIRRPWAEEVVWVGLSIVVGAYLIVVLDKGYLLWFYPLWIPAYLAYNRRLGLDLTPTSAVVRRPYLRARTLRREEIAGVSVERGMVTLRDTANRPHKLTVMNAAGRFGRARADRTRAQIQQWLDRPPPPALAQIPGSASI